MPKSMRSKEDTTQYLSDKENMKDFIRKLHMYLDSHMDFTLKNGFTIWLCPSEKKDRLKYFISFCENKYLDWEAAADMFQYAFGDRRYHCDCNYLLDLDIDDDGNVYSAR